MKKLEVESGEVIDGTNRGSKDRSIHGLGVYLVQQSRNRR
jgi:hypothetical protein